MTQYNDSMSMYDEVVDFEGITLHVDHINREIGGENQENVMGIFYEEQPFMWYTLKTEIAKTIEEVTGSINFLDVGCGSGFWANIVAKHFGGKILAIDISKRAVDFTRENAERNHLSIEVRQERYNLGTAGPGEVKVIGLYPPYHPYPEEIERFVPFLARGGYDGQSMFREQLQYVGDHLAKNGIAIFNMMCLGKNGKPDFLEYIPDLVKGDPSIYYTNILPSISSRYFLEKLYGDSFKQWQKSLYDKSPELYYTTGFIRKDGIGQVHVFESNVDLKGRNWQTRIDLNYQMVLFAK